MKYTDKQILDFIDEYCINTDAYWWEKGQFREVIEKRMSLFGIRPTTTDLTVHKCTCPQCTSEVVVSLR